MGIIDLCCATDSGWAHSAAMLHSVLTHNPGDQIRVHYLHGPGFPARARDGLRDMVQAGGAEIEFLTVADERFARLPGMPDGPTMTPAVWYPVLLPELLGDLDRALYLDIDLIVLDSLAGLWDTDLDDHYLAAVTNVLEPRYAHRPAELGLAGPQAYFNSGVQLLNLAALRRDRCPDAVIEYALANREGLLWRDQDALSAVVGERRLPLHPRFNAMNSLFVFAYSDDVFGAEIAEEARRHPVIRHFEGPTVNKPWHYLCEREHRDLYLHHRRQTPWPRLRPEGRTPRAVLRRLAGRGGGAVSA